MADWQQFLNGQGSNPAMCGVYTDNKLLLGGYGSGAIYSWMPFATELNDSGESILAMCEFKGVVYATSENNNTEDYKTRVFRRTTDGWIAAAIDGFAAYFMCVWGDNLIVTTADSDNLNSIDVWISSNGVDFSHMAHLGNWLWVPAVYKNVLYLLGHRGAVEDNSGSMVVKWNGSSFVEVPALCDVPGVLEWQCAKEHNGYMFLGAGGWILGRGTSTAVVYRFDGTNCIAVKTDGTYHEVQALLSSTYNGILYASFGSGFKTDVTAGSQIWASTDNGATWVNGGYFAGCCQLYVLLDTPYGFVAAGGNNGCVIAYFYPTAAPGPTPSVTELSPPTDVSATVIQSSTEAYIWITWVMPLIKTHVYGYQIYCRSSEKDVDGYLIHRVDKTTSEFKYIPTVGGYYQFRVRSVGFPAKDVTKRLVSEWGIPTTGATDNNWAKPVPFNPEYINMEAPPAPVATMTTLAQIDITVVPRTGGQLGIASTELYAARSDGTAKDGSESIRLLVDLGRVSSYSLTNPIPGVSYIFYARYNIPGTSSWSALSPASAKIIIPGSLSCPKLVTCFYSAPTEITLNWVDASEGEVLFEVDRSFGGLYTKVVELAAGTTQFIDTNVTLNTTVSYRVRARGGLVVSEYGVSNIIPVTPQYFTIALISKDLDIGLATFAITQNWKKYTGFPYYLDIQISDNSGVTFTSIKQYYYNAIPINVDVPIVAGKTYAVQMAASNGAGTMYSNSVQFTAIATLYTVATPPIYEPGKTQNRSVVYGPDGAGEAGYALTGFARHLGFPYAGIVDEIGLLDKEPQEVEIITQPIGREWYGEKTTYNAELEGTTNRDIVVSINSRNDYKVPTFDKGKEVALRGRGRVGYIKSGHEFEVRFKWSSGIPHYFQVWDAHIWVKMTGRQGLSTLPYFYGSKGYNPRGAK